MPAYLGTLQNMIDPKVRVTMINHLLAYKKKIVPKTFITCTLWVYFLLEYLSGTSPLLSVALGLKDRPVQVECPLNVRPQDRKSRDDIGLDQL